MTIGIILTTSLLVFSQSGTLKGKIVDKDTKEPIPFANIVIELGGSQQGGATSDFDGNYSIKPINPGKYSVRTTYVGYQSIQINNVLIRSDKITFLDLELPSTATNLEEVVITDYKVPLISKDKTSSGGTVTAEEIEKMPNKSASSIATTVGGVFSEDGEVGSIRGQRSSGTVYYIDGIKVQGSSNLPESAIDQVSVVLGGVPAQYGDATGGIINITTKGPSRKFGAGVEVQSSEYLDAFGYNRVGLNMNGPLIKSRDKKASSSLLGYFIAGDLIYKQDGRPTGTGVYKVKDDVLAGLRETPLRPSGSGQGTYNNSLFLHSDDFEHVDATENTSNLSVNMSGKIDVKTSPTVNLSFGGSFNYYDGNSFNFYNSLFNYDNNTQVINNTWRVFGRFSQRFPTEKGSTSLIKNAFYTLQVDYSKYTNTTQDPNHKDDLWKYGYVGKFNTYKRKNYDYHYDSISGVTAYHMDNWADTLVSFQGSNVNPVLSAYTEQYYSFYDENEGNYDKTDNIIAGGGLLNSMTPNGVYNLYSNVGTVQSGYSHYESDQLGINFNVSADIGNHEVKFGLMYEQKAEKYYSYQAGSMWQLMRDLTNSHIQQLDLSDPHLVYLDGQFMDTVNYHRLYDGASQSNFDASLRSALGLRVNGTEWIDVDSYDMDDRTINYYDENGDVHTGTLSRDIDIDMFSADELLNSGGYNAYYFGYDYLGNENSSKPSLDDFFNERDDKDNFARNVGAFEPIYMSGYIQDKFAFKDLIFNIGLRVDRFDANQMVLKDPYLLYNARTVGEVKSNNIGDVDLGEVVLPENMGDDYVVYVDNRANPTSIMGYRNEGVWYDSEGIEVANPEDHLDAGNGVTPLLVNKDNPTVSSEAFKDYDPQWSFMPRIAFSFPISDEALFFAHYDVLTQRPKNNLRMNPMDYYFMPVKVMGSSSINNPDLKPEKTIDYELGFQQKVTNTSSIILSAFYREIRDQIQSYRYTAAYPKTYYSYSNLDFGTVKGLTVTYDLRRTKNIRLKTSYTLQFANGTGSNTETAKSLIQSGQPNLRTLLPLDIDRRHAVNIMVDYRFGEGASYNGPVTTRKEKGTGKVKNIKWLENTGINFTLSGGSGTPYTKSSKIYSLVTGGRIIEGSINGARKPSSFRVDARIDRDIVFTVGKGEKKHDTYLNVYLQVLNVFNSMNVLNVYSATGNADDDGYLSAAEWQTTINSMLDTESFRTMYAMRLNSPYNFSSPRQIRVGLAFNF